MPRLILRNLLGTGEICHFAAPRLTVLTPLKPHAHDFLEIFWVDAGAGWHWLADGRVPLTLGDLVFVRAADSHAFSRHADAEALGLVNLAFPVAAWNALRARYGLDDNFAARSARPRSRRLNADTLVPLRELTADLRHGRRDALALDRFLLNLHSLLSATPGDAEELPPAWLSRALAAVAGDAQRLADGPKALVRAAGRSHEHVSRAVRRYYSQTPTDLLNSLRLNRAAARLTETDDAILEVALDCGFENLGHFYTLFRAKFGTTPRRYRARQHAIVQPSGDHGRA